ILLFDDDHVKIGDFGLGKRLEPDSFTASLTITGHQGGTRCYMSPEQETNVKEADARSDIYALGIVLFVLITGENPCDFDLDEVDEEFRVIVEKCTYRKPERRYQSVDELIAAFERITDSNSFELVGARVRDMLKTRFEQPASEENIHYIAEGLLD